MKNKRKNLIFIFSILSLLIVPISLSYEISEYCVNEKNQMTFGNWKLRLDRSTAYLNNMKLERDEYAGNPLTYFSVLLDGKYLNYDAEKNLWLVYTLDGDRYKIGKCSLIGEEKSNRYCRKVYYEDGSVWSHFLRLTNKGWVNGEELFDDDNCYLDNRPPKIGEIKISGLQKGTWEVINNE